MQGAIRAMRGRGRFAVFALALLGAGLGPTVVRAEEGARPPLPPPRVVRRRPGQPPAPAPAPPARDRSDAPRTRPAPPPPPPVPPRTPPGRPAAERPVLPPGVLPPPRVVRTIRSTPAVPAPQLPGPRPSFPPPAPEGDGGDGGLGPTEPPPRPIGGATPRPQDLVFEVDRRRGLIRAEPEGEDRFVIVMAGNPRITGFAHTRGDGSRVEAISVKANAIVVWIDVSKFEDLSVFQGLREDPAAATSQTRGAERPSGAALLREAVLGLYMEGAVEIRYGDTIWRADVAHLDPRENKGLLLRPQVVGRPAVPNGVVLDIPLQVRAERARLLGEGFAVFDNAEVTTSSANDRLALTMRELTVEEIPADEAAAEGEGGILGFRRLADQDFRATGTVFRGEHLPLFYWPSATFDYGLIAEKRFPFRLKRFSTGDRSSYGYFASVGIGGPVGDARDPLFDWTVDLAGYTKRGPAGGIQIDWDHPSTFGTLWNWGIADFSGKDRTGYQAPSTLRGFTSLESRSRPNDWLIVDAEWNYLSDQDVIREFFEKEQEEHKDRESYLRLKAQRGPWVGTLTGKWHARPFETETTQLPELGVWGTSVGLVTPSRRGGFGIDVTTDSRVGYLQRRMEEGSLEPDYEALRVYSDTRLNFGVDAGDVRLSGYTGGQIASYLDRNDAPDFTRSALIAGVRANVEAHRTFGASGGIFQLDRLRHIVGLDVGYGVRAFDSRTIAETPQFDYRDMTEDRGEAVVSLRNRLQTRGLEGELRTLLDLRLDYFDYVNGIGPYGIEQDGEVSAYLRGQPREEFFVSGEASWAIGPDEFENGFFGVGTRNFERATIFTGLRYLRGEAITPIIDISWRWSDKYEVRLREAYNFRDDRNSFRLLLRRHSQDHIIVFGASVRESDDVTFQFSFEPTFDRDPGDLQGFNDEPAFDPWGTVGWWHTR